ncbi:MAG: hypothetical protein Fur0018_11160 [Anaerolineales bacterium]
MSLNHKCPFGIALLVSILTLLCSPIPARADVAPPEQPPGANIVPGGESTQVRMAAETVSIEVQADAPEGILGQAHVVAEFQMRNLGNETETLQVRFPISANDGFGRYPEIHDFQVFVNGQAAAVTPLDSSGEQSIRWVQFPAAFPPGEQVTIRVSYTLQGTGEYPYISFGYLLETGAGWKGSIGSADLTVRLPYPVNAYNVFIDSSPGWGQTSANAALSGNELRWHYDDFEPGNQDNLSVVMVMPSVWQKVLGEQANLEANPNDGEAWGRLGKLYKEISLLRRGVRFDAGGLELYDMSVQAYERCLALLPKDAAWHAGFADLLISRYIWEEYYAQEPPVNLQRAVQEFHTAIQLSPANPVVHRVLDKFIYDLTALEAVAQHGDTYDFPWLTATPTALPTKTATPAPLLPSPMPTLTPTPAPTLTPEPAAMPSPSEPAPASRPTDTPSTPRITDVPPPQSKPGVPRCGSAALPLGGALFFASLTLHKRRKT